MPRKYLLSLRLINCLILLFSLQVVNKFYEIRERENGLSADMTLQDKCSCLLDDPPDNWIFNSDKETSTSKYIVKLTYHLLYGVYAFRN